MQTLLLGLGFGMVTVAMPGPISVSLVQLACLQGRASGARAAAGIAAGDAVLGLFAIAVVTLGAGLPASVFSTVQLGTAILLVVFGVALMARPVGVQERVTRVSRPLRTFLMVTTLMPSAIGSWLALLTAMPFATDRYALFAFSSGVVIVSIVWHQFLGLGAGVLGGRLTPRALRIGTRVGGLATIGLGLWALTPG